MLSIGQDIRLPLATSRPKCNSILHLFGEWLFEAALIGGESWKENSKSKIEKKCMDFRIKIIFFI